MYYLYILNVIESRGDTMPLCSNVMTFRKNLSKLNLDFCWLWIHIFILQIRIFKMNFWNKIWMFLHPPPRLTRIKLSWPQQVRVYSRPKWPHFERVPGTLQTNLLVVMLIDTWVSWKDFIMMKTAMERVGIVGAGMTGATVASLLRSECAESKLVVLDKGRGVGKNIGIILYTDSMCFISYSCVIF